MISKYKSYPVAAVITVVSLGFTQQAVAEESASEISYGGSLRLRYEDKINFDLDDGEQDYTLSQLRLHVDWKPNKDAQLFLELQDARVYGENKNGVPPVNDDVRNQSFHDDLDIHRFYYQQKWEDKTLKVGRQKFNLGDQRLVASLEWVNTARVNDGIRFDFGEKSSREVVLFASRLVTVDPTQLNDDWNSNNRYFDSWFHGAYVTDNSSIESGELQYWYFLRENNDFDDTVNTFGARYLSKIGDWDLDVQGAFQTGDFGGLDHRAGMVHAGVETDAIGGKLGFGYNFATGDDDSTDDKHQTFDNLYPLNHAYYGYMDLFSLQNIHNLEGVYKTGIFDKTKLRVALQAFWLADTNDAWYNAGLAPNNNRLAAALASSNVDNFVGSEIDITVSHPITKKIELAAGYSHFFAGGYTEDTGASGDADFVFLMTKMNF